MHQVWVEYGVTALHGVQHVAYDSGETRDNSCSRHVSRNPPGVTQPPGDRACACRATGPHACWHTTTSPLGALVHGRRPHRHQDTLFISCLIRNPISHYRLPAPSRVALGLVQKHGQQLPHRHPRQLEPANTHSHFHTHTPPRQRTRSYLAYPNTPTYTTPTLLSYTPTRSYLASSMGMDMRVRSNTNTLTHTPIHTPLIHTHQVVLGLLHGHGHEGAQEGVPAHVVPVAVARDGVLLDEALEPLRSGEGRGWEATPSE